MVERRIRRTVRWWWMLLAVLAAGSAARAQPPVFWLQTDASTSTYGTTTNPVVSVRPGQSVRLYLWLLRNSAVLGFDGISLDVRLISTNGGQATATLTVDRPPGRWYVAANGTARTDSGGTGVDDCNMIDLTGTDTLGPSAVRLGYIDLTGVRRGTVLVFLCVGQYLLADSGSAPLVYIGMASGATAPETLSVSGGVSGLCSGVPEATVQVTPHVGDFDSDGDVDLDDFGFIQVCLTGAGVPQNNPACAPARIDDDNDVDGNDLAVVRNCLSGAGIPFNPACAP